MKRILLFSAGGLCLLIGGIYLILSVLVPKTGYINTTRVFSEFQMTRELEKELENTEKKRKESLDSLRVQLSVLYRDIQNTKEKNQEKIGTFKTLQQQFYLKEKQFEKDNEDLSAQYNTQIWTQLNQYIKEFGDQNSYTYIYGANGEGNLMYAKDKEDITEDVIRFIQKKYKGVKP